MTTPPLLQLDSVSKSFGPLKILEDICFEVNPGQVVALLGDNGAGKSTLIKTIAGFHRPTAGRLLWNGSTIHFSEKKGPQEARDLGIETVYQHLSLVESMSIARNFFLGREPLRKVMGISVLDHGKMVEIARDALKEIGIRRKLEPTDHVGKLSGGERQAIAISRARHFGVKLLILDEPTSALSLRQTEKVLNYIVEAAKAGIGVIFITHTLPHIEGIVDRITVLFHGKKVGDYLPGDVSTQDISQLITQGN